MAHPCRRGHPSKKSLFTIKYVILPPNRNVLFRTALHRIADHHDMARWCRQWCNFHIRSYGLDGHVTANPQSWNWVCCYTNKDKCTNAERDHDSTNSLEPQKDITTIEEWGVDSQSIHSPPKHCVMNLLPHSTQTNYTLHEILSPLSSQRVISGFQLQRD